MLRLLIGLSRSHKRFIMIFGDIVAMVVSFWLAFNLRLDFQHLLLSQLELIVLGVTVFLTVSYFANLGLYRMVVRYIGLESVWVMLKGAFVSLLVLVCLAFILNMWIPRSVPFVYFLLVLLMVSSSRFLIRHFMNPSAVGTKRNFAIYGAGSAGVQAMKSLLRSPGYRPVLFIDDDVGIQGRLVNGVPVVSAEKFAHIVSRREITDLILAMPNLSRDRRSQIIDSVSTLPVHVHTVPCMIDIVTGKARVEEFRDIDIEDLLGRDPVSPDPALMSAIVKNKTVLVTGAGGSIGSELCRQIIKVKPRIIILFEQSEYALYEIEKELLAQVQTGDIDIHPVLGSVLDKELIETVFSSFSVETVFHAAAYKHVPLVEKNIVAGVRNNVFGTLNIATAAESAGVKSCVLISTDKAVRPTNVMGASKRLSELIFQAMCSRSRVTCFSMVRFGNVLGSSGSVIPLFRDQVASGGPVTVTHPEIMRYFMTIPEAAQLVIQAGAMARGGEVFVLDMGEPVKIADLARKMIALMGLTAKDKNSEGDIEIVYTGLRPGEKLFEELLIDGDALSTSHPRVFKVDERFLEWHELEQLLYKLAKHCEDADCEVILSCLYDAPLGYQPDDSMVDILSNQEVSRSTMSPIANVIPITNK